MTIRNISRAIMCVALLTLTFSITQAQTRLKLNPEEFKANVLKPRANQTRIDKPKDRGLLRPFGPVSLAAKFGYILCTELDIHSTNRNNGLESNNAFRGSDGRLQTGKNRLFSYIILGALTLVEKKVPKVSILATGFIAGGRCAAAANNY